jgi:parallel beta-helix repeat protein
LSRKTVSGIMLAVLLTGMLSLASNIQPAKASGTIYIKADGSIDPPTAPISSVDNVTYTFTSNIYDPIVVERSNIIVDGNGYTLQGAETGSGFSLVADNVTIRKTTVQKFRWGIVISSTGNTVINNIITYNRIAGIYLGWNSANKIIGNRIVNTGLKI